MAKFDFDMYDRLIEEISRISKNQSELARKIGASRNLVYVWLNNYTIPSPYYLARLYEQGMDVIYVLTGERTRGGEASV